MIEIRVKTERWILSYVKSCPHSSIHLDGDHHGQYRRNCRHREIRLYDSEPYNSPIVVLSNRIHTRIDITCACALYSHSIRAARLYNRSKSGRSFGSMKKNDGVSSLKYGPRRAVHGLFISVYVKQTRNCCQWRTVRKAGLRRVMQAVSKKFVMSLYSAALMSYEQLQTALWAYRPSNLRYTVIFIDLNIPTANRAAMYVICHLFMGSHGLSTSGTTDVYDSSERKARAILMTANIRN
jgi:hypothetical protein